jgi:hypothetical protein
MKKIIFIIIIIIIAGGILWWQQQSDVVTKNNSSCISDHTQCRTCQPMHDNCFDETTIDQSCDKCCSGQYYEDYIDHVPCECSEGAECICAGAFYCGIASDYGMQKELKDCLVWFDGCNTCTVENGRIHMCTEQECTEFAEPKCLEYKE